MRVYPCRLAVRMEKNECQMNMNQDYGEIEVNLAIVCWKLKIFQNSRSAMAANNRPQINQIIVCRKWITGGKIRMILIIEFIVLSVVYISMAVIMKYNNISFKTKTYWFMMALAVFLYMFGFVIGKYYTG